MCTIRTYNGVISELRKLFIKNRNGIVIDNIKTRDLDEYIIGMRICMEQLRIASGEDLNNPICIKVDKDTYIIIFIIKNKREYLVNLYMLHKLGENVHEFRNWFTRNIKESVGFKA